MPERQISVHPLPRNLGASIGGVDLSKGLSADQFETILSAFHTHQLLVFPHQELEAKDLVDLSAKFGHPEPNLDASHTHDDFQEILLIGNLKVNGKMRSMFVNAREEWHYDYSYMPNPALGALFYGLEVPPEGGDTLFADGYAAYEALPDAMKAKLDGLTGIYSWAYLHEQLEVMDPTRAPLSDEEKRRYPPVSHPIVRRHPVTGKKVLHLCPEIICEIPGMSFDEMRALMAELLDHATQEQFIYRHKWQKNDLVIFDNRSLMHTATTFDTDKYLRLMWRTTILDPAFQQAA